MVAAVDNFDAKVLLNELIRQLPEDRRPIVIMDGTHDEMAQSVILDNTEFCLRCLIDENWMKDSSIRTSCTGPQVRQIDGVNEIVRTSNLASSMAAHLSAEQLRASVVGNDGVMNRRLTYTAYPHLELSSSHPIARKLSYNNHSDVRDHNIVGPILMSSGVCEGHNALLLLCFRRIGIPCIKVYGKTKTDGWHCWTIAWINGTPVHCDVTPSFCPPCTGTAFPIHRPVPV